MKTRSSTKVRELCLAAIIAALYVTLTYVSSIFGLANMAIQVRISEALCVLACFTPGAIWGMSLGCFISNLILSAPPQDLIFGTIATLIGTFGGYLLRKKQFFVPLPTVLSNALIIPFVLKYAYNLEGTVPFFALTVGLGEIISAWVIGLIFLAALNKSGLGSRLGSKKENSISNF